MSHPLRKAAMGQPCTLRLPGVCVGGTETTVLAHLYVGPKAMGGKGPDYFGFFACHACHAAWDGYKAENRHCIALQALQETWENLFDRGILSVGRERPVERQRLPKIIPHKGVQML